MVLHGNMLQAGRKARRTLQNPVQDKQGMNSPLAHLGGGKLPYMQFTRRASWIARAAASTCCVIGLRRLACCRGSAATSPSAWAFTLSTNAMTSMLSSHAPSCFHWRVLCGWLVTILVACRRSVSK